MALSLRPATFPGSHARTALPLGRPIPRLSTIRRRASLSSSSDDELRSPPPPPTPTSFRPAPVTAESAKALAEELLDWERFGQRGELFFVAQMALVALVLFPPSGIRAIVDVAGASMALLGVTLITVGGIDLGQSLSPLPQPRDEHTLMTDGAYALCRHPMYGGIIVTAAGLALFTGDEARLGLAALLFFVLDKKAALEEGYLEERYGAAYTAYKATTKKLIPWLY
jgi:protein-S-isoprenylcysteine O-methyltransferase Ste14